MADPTLLAEVVATSRAVAAASGRSAKRDALAELLGQLSADEVAVATAFLTGQPRQGRIGVGWRTLSAIDAAPAAEPTLTVVEVDAALDSLAAVGGPGSSGDRTRPLTILLGRATAAETTFLGYRPDKVFTEADTIATVRAVGRADG